jgi:hypothetical protein
MKRLLMILLLAAASLPGAVFSFSSSFETGTEGWTIKTYGFALPGGTGPVQVASGGASGGYLETEDTMDGFLFFIAPPAWTGDFTGGTLSFYLRNQNPANYGGSIQPLVWLTDGTTNLFALSGPTLPGVSGVDWTFSSIPLDLGFAGWSTSPYGLVSPAPGVVNTVLSNVTQVGILGDRVSGFYGKQPPQYDFGHDITGLDEVRLYSSEIPEPGTAGLLLLGLAAAAGWRRRSGRKA